MRELLCFALFLIGGIAWADCARASELPPTIAACVTDTECELAAADLCAEGLTEWCEDSSDDD